MKTDRMVIVSGEEVWSKYNVRYMVYEDNHLALMTKKYQSYLLNLAMEKDN